jgi:RNA polymerase sigma-70 factor (ECF subfamily)
VPRVYAVSRGLLADGDAGLEPRLRALHEKGDHAAFVTVLLQGYGAELSSFVASLVRRPALADDGFAMFSADLWMGAPSFRYGCSARTWAYALARHAALRVRKTEMRRARGGTPLSELSRQPAAALEAPRSSTHPYLRTDLKERVRNLRDRLSEQDRTMLGLRLDRGLAWREIAYVLSNAAEPLSEVELSTEAARLRQRMTAVKAQLKALARDAGWLER